MMYNIIVVPLQIQVLGGKDVESAQPVCNQTVGAVLSVRISLSLVEQERTSSVVL